MLRHVYSPPNRVGGSLPSLTPFAFGLCLSLIRGLEIKHLKVSVAQSDYSEKEPLDAQVTPSVEAAQSGAEAVVSTFPFVIASVAPSW